MSISIKREGGEVEIEPEVALNGRCWRERANVFKRSCLGLSYDDNEWGNDAMKGRRLVARKDFISPTTNHKQTASFFFSPGRRRDYAFFSFSSPIPPSVGGLDKRQRAEWGRGNTSYSGGHRYACLRFSDAE